MECLIQMVNRYHDEDGRAFTKHRKTPSQSHCRLAMIPINRQTEQEYQYFKPDPSRGNDPVQGSRNIRHIEIRDSSGQIIQGDFLI